MSEVKMCVNCRHSFVGMGRVVCNRRKLHVTVERYTGLRRVFDRMTNATWERSEYTAETENSVCGPEAKFYRPKWWRVWEWI